MKTRSRRRLNPARPKDQTPAWVGNPKEMVRRLPAFAALELCGAISRRQRETGDQFASRWRLAAEHRPAVVPLYGGARGGSEVDEYAQAAARRDVCRALRLAGLTAGLLVSLANDERPRLDEVAVVALRVALDRIAGG